MEINLKNKKDILANINKLFNGRNDATKFVGDSASMIPEAKRKEAEEEPEPEPSKTKTKSRKSPLELHKEFIAEIKNKEKKYKCANI